MQLQAHVNEFETAGIKVAALTYDAPELQAAFVTRAHISYPLLSDIEASSVRALGVLNADYAPGDDNYGLPYPGVFVVRPDGAIAGKLFLTEYSVRVDAQSVLTYADRVLQ